MEYDLQKQYKYIKNKRKELKLILINHYSNGTNKCSCCRETHIEFLTLEHINGGGNAEKLKYKNNQMTYYRQLVKRGFPKGYGVLCLNCNIYKGNSPDGKCIHERDTMA